MPQEDTKSADYICGAAGDNNIATMIEFAIMQFNGVGVAKHEVAAKLFIKAAGHSNPAA